MTEANKQGDRLETQQPQRSHFEQQAAERETLLAQQRAANEARISTRPEDRRRFEKPSGEEPAAEPLLAGETSEAAELIQGKSFAELDQMATALDGKVKELRRARMASGVRTPDDYAQTREERDAASLRKRVRAAMDEHTLAKIRRAREAGSLPIGD